MEKPTRYTLIARNTLRLAGWFALFSAFVATPALSQPVADLSVTLTGPNQAVPPVGITFGGTATYIVVVTNAGPSNATAVQLNATLNRIRSSSELTPELLREGLVVLARDPGRKFAAYTLDSSLLTALTRRSPELFSALGLHR